MQPIIFLMPRLVGARFENHAIPLDILKDLAVFEEMVIEVAKWKFRQQHPDRKRMPRGFTEGFELKLTALCEGSAVPVISLFIDQPHLFPPDSQVYLEQARDSIICAIGAAEENTPINLHLPESSLGYFDRIGRDLRNGEAIEFSTPTKQISARLTRETRKRLVLAASNVRELTEVTSVRGVIPEADQDDMTFEIQNSDGRKIKAPMSPEHMDTILEAFNGYKTGFRVLLKGVGKFTRQDRLERFESIEYISTIDPLDVPARLDEFRSLQNGWLDGKGLAPQHDGLDWLAQIFDERFPDNLPLPFAYPTAEGGVQMEWSIDNNEASIDIDLGKHHGDWHSLNLETGRENSRDLDLDSIDDWDWLIGQLREMTGGAA